MAQLETIDRILDSAEMLFAEKGFAETSLRMITSKANVNLAAVNYHFGSKNALIQAVFSRFLDPLCKALDKDFLQYKNTLSSHKKASIEEVLFIYAKGLLEVDSQNPNSVTTFMRLLGLAYTQSQAHLRKYLEIEYKQTFNLFMELLKSCTPVLSSEERFWRIQFFIGAMAFTMSSIQSLTDIFENSSDAKTDPKKLLERIVPFLSAGLMSPP